MKDLKSLLKQLGFTERVDENGKVIPEPKTNKYKGGTGAAFGATNQLTKEWYKYENAKERVFLPMLSEFVKAVKDYSVSQYTEWLNTTRLDETVKYANFITQPLTKGMFVPCDLEGNVLVEPRNVLGVDMLNKKGRYFDELEQYQQAKDRVLFDKALYRSGNTWTESKDKLWLVNFSGYKTIEQAINNNVKLYLL